MKKRMLIAAALVVGVLAGCRMYNSSLPEFYVKPTVAVMKFENRAAFPMDWKIGGGMRDILVDRLVATQRFQVIERPELDSVLRELHLQKSGATRRQKRARQGRLKNAQYLIKGTITDFGHVSSGGGFLNIAEWDILGRNSRAVMSMTLYVVEVESGEVICSKSLQESIPTNEVKVQAMYKNVGFGGSLFYKKPLGRATANVIDRAVREVAYSIAARPWLPKVAMIQPDGSIIINGGAEQRIARGQEYEIAEDGEPIVDPDTGDVLGRQPGKILGRVRVVQVDRRYSVAKIVSGHPADLRIGQRCRRVRMAAMNVPLR